MYSVFRSLCGCFATYCTSTRRVSPVREASALTRRPRSPAVRNALRNQISSLVKKMVIRWLWPSLAAWRYPRQAKLLQSCRHTGQSERGFETELYSMHSRITPSRSARSRRIGSVISAAVRKIAAGPHQIYCSNTSSADADAGSLCGERARWLETEHCRRNHHLNR
jgi:hypothetical protein